jgi:phosphoserine phosphatase RsbU/P
MPQLRYLDGAGQLVTFDLTTPKVVIGRADTCQLVLEGDLISREHTQIEREADGRWRVRDLGSRNKTFLNGILINDALLTGGDILRIGVRQVEFREGPAQPTATLQELLSEDRKEPPGTEYVKNKESIPLSSLLIERLSELTFQTSLIPRVEDLADVALTRLLMELSAERGFVALKGAGHQDVDMLAARAFSRPAGTNGARLNQSFVQAGLVQGIGGRYPTDAKFMGQVEGLPTTAIVAPLVSNQKPVGVIYLDRPMSRKLFEASQLHYLMAAGATLGAAMTQSHRRLGTMQRQSAAANLAVLRRMQTTINPPINGGDAFTLAGRTLLGCERCGDLRDVILLGQDKAVVLMMDATGTGMTGFVHAASVLTGLRAVIEHDPDGVDLQSAFNSINRTLASKATRQLVSCLAIAVDISRGSLTYLNTGMPPPILLIAPGRFLSLDRTNLLLGVDAECTYEPTMMELPEAFRLIGHSDGLVEAVNASGTDFGVQHLHDVIAERASFANPSTLVETAMTKLVEHLNGKPIEDDATILVLSRG